MHVNVSFKELRCKGSQEMRWWLQDMWSCLCTGSFKTGATAAIWMQLGDKGTPDHMLIGAPEHYPRQKPATHPPCQGRRPKLPRQPGRQRVGMVGRCGSSWWVLLSQSSKRGHRHPVRKEGGIESSTYLSHIHGCKWRLKACKQQTHGQSLKETFLRHSPAAGWSSHWPPCSSYNRRCAKLGPFTFVHTWRQGWLGFFWGWTRPGNSDARHLLQAVLTGVRWPGGGSTTMAEEALLRPSHCHVASLCVTLCL